MQSIHPTADARWTRPSLGASWMALYGRLVSIWMCFCWLFIQEWIAGPQIPGESPG